MKKRIISLFITALLLLSFSSIISLPAAAETYSGSCGDDLNWYFDTNSGVLTISGTGEMYDYGTEENQCWSEYIEHIKTAVINAPITYITSFAFYKCSSLESITIPDSVRTIDYCAFSGCNSLKSITIPDSVTKIEDRAFENCLYLENVTINGPVVTIGEAAFISCESLESITIPDSITQIGYRAFGGCDSLTDVLYSGSKEQRNSIFISNRNDDLVYAHWQYNVKNSEPDNTVVDDKQTVESENNDESEVPTDTGAKNETSVNNVLTVVLVLNFIAIITLIIVLIFKKRKN